MQIFTIGFTGKSAERFFSLISENKIDRVVDVRLYNNTQLAGFSKSGDLRYFLRRLCACEYSHAPELAPSKELFDAYKSARIGWQDYEREYAVLIAARRATEDFAACYPGERICLLCAEVSPRYCHRRIAASTLAERYGAEVRDL